MVKRVQALQQLAEVTGERFVTWEHYARMMTKAPGRYSTMLGRGHRHSHCSAEWLVSTFLAGVIGDPKNAATKVPECGDLICYNGHFTNLNVQDKKYITENISHVSEKTSRFFGNDDDFFVGKTLFETIRILVSWMSNNSLGVVLRRINNEFRITINIGKSISAEAEYLQKTNHNSQWWLVSPYKSTLPRESSSLAVIERRAVINREHIQMLATLYADTLKHKPATQVSRGPTSSHSQPLDDQGVPCTSTKNVDVAQSEEASSRNPDRNSTTISAGRTSKARRERGNP